MLKRLKRSKSDVEIIVLNYASILFDFANSRVFIVYINSLRFEVIL